MEFKGRYLIPASQEKVWAALNDPQILCRCIPGCERMEKIDDTHFTATAVLKIALLKTTINATITLEDVDPPRHCTLKGEGQGGVAGFARGEADIVLMPQTGGTELSYVTQANIGGKLAQLGQRLIGGAAKRIADDFFARFAAAIASIPEPVMETPKPAITPPAAPAMEAPSEPRRGLAPEIWVVGLIALIAILLLLFGTILK